MTGIKPKVFKMCGAWLWLCDHGHGAVGDTFPTDQWRDPWAVCLGAATKHAIAYHDTRPVKVLNP